MPTRRLSILFECEITRCFGLEFFFQGGVFFRGGEKGCLGCRVVLSCGI